MPAGSASLGALPQPDQETRDYSQLKLWRWAMSPCEMKHAQQCTTTTASWPALCSRLALFSIVDLRRILPRNRPISLSLRDLSRACSISEKVAADAVEHASQNGSAADLQKRESRCCCEVGASLAPCRLKYLASGYKLHAVFICRRARRSLLVLRGESLA